MKAHYCLRVVLCPLLLFFIPLNHACPRDNKIRVVHHKISPPLSSGMKCPDIVLRFVDGSRRQLRNYAGKPLLLDFFSIYCGTCVKELPFLQKIQDSLHGAVQVVLVTTDAPAELKAFFAHNRFVKGVRLPIAINGKAVIPFFPHLIIPHIAWLDKEQRVSAITGYREVTGDNIAALAKGALPHLPQKRDLIQFTASHPVLLSLSNQAGITPDYSSAFGGWIDGAQSVVGLYPEGSHRRLLFLNQPLTAMYGSLEGLPDNLILPELKDSTRMVSENTTEWERNHLYTYELTAPLSTDITELYRLAKADLDRYLHLQTGYEERMMRCYALVKQGALLPSADTESYLHISVLDSQWTARRATPSQLVVAMNNCAPLGGPLFIDSTGDATPVDVELTVPDVRDMNALQKGLAPFRLGLVATERKMRVFVIRDEPRDIGTPAAAASP